MVMRGAEPIVVDTGYADKRDDFLQDGFGIVDPDDIRWVFISHDDVDHTGNVTALMDAAPRATLVINWFMMERMGSTLEVPLCRTRWVRDGESFVAGDRRLQAVRPPVFDSPTTRGLFDPTTGVYRAADAFATPMLAPVDTVDALDPMFWHDGNHRVATAFEQMRTYPSVTVPDEPGQEMLEAMIAAMSVGASHRRVTRGRAALNGRARRQVR